MYKTRQDTVRSELKINCEETLVDWYNLCREVCSEVLEQENGKVGGPGKIVMMKANLVRENITKEEGRMVFGCLGV